MGGLFQLFQGEGQGFLGIGPLPTFLPFRVGLVINKARVDCMNMDVRLPTVLHRYDQRSICSEFFSYVPNL